MDERDALSEENDVLHDGILALRDDLAAARADAETWHNTATESGLRVVQLRNELAAARALLLEARDWFHPRDPKVPGALVDMCDRIDAALAGEERKDVP